MSYTGEILTSSFVLVGYAVGAALALTGAALVGTAKVAAAAGRAVNEGVKSARTVSLGKSLSAAERNIASLDSELSAQMDAARNECCRQYEEEIKNIEEIFSREHDTEAFTAACSRAGQKLSAQLAAEEKKINSEYIGRIKTELEKARVQAKQAKDEVKNSLARIESEQQKAEMAKEYAQQMLDETRVMLSDFGVRYSESRKAEKMLGVLEAAYKKAESSIAEGMYEAALAEAYSLRDAIVLRVGEMLESELDTKQKYINAKTLLDVCTELLRSYESFSFSTDRTFSGDVYTEEIEDFTVYYRGEYEVFAEKLRYFSDVLAADYTDIAANQLTDVTEALLQWQDGFISSTVTASERLDNLYLRVETMKMLYSEYSEKGFELESIDEENELDYISMDLFNPETEEKVCLKFAAENEGGHITMNIVVDDRTEYAGGESDAEKKRVERRENISRSLSESAVGKGLSLRQRCSNPGVRLR